MTNASRTTPQIGDRMPDLALHDLNGNEISLSRYAGKKYILFMWASW